MSHIMHTLTIEERDTEALPRILGYIAQAIDEIALTVERGSDLLAPNPEAAAFLATIADSTRIAGVRVQAMRSGELDLLADAILDCAKRAGLSVDQWLDAEIARGKES